MQAAESDNDRVPPNAGSRLASGQLDRKQWLIAQAVTGEESVDLVPPCECVAVAKIEQRPREALIEEQIGEKRGTGSLGAAEPVQQIARAARQMAGVGDRHRAQIAAR